MAWARNILRVNLTEGTCKNEPLNMEWAQKYLGHAKACPTEAITYIDANWTGLDRMRAWASKTDAGAQAEA